MTFDEFVAARLAALLRYATALTCDPHLAEDIVQEVLLRVQPRWERIADMLQRDAYVKRMILNEMLSWRRRRWTGVLLLRGEALDHAAGMTPDEAPALDERAELLGHIAKLPPKQRAVVVLRYYEGHSDAEIAELLGCGETTVRSNCARALATLRTALPSDGRPTRVEAP